MESRLAESVSVAHGEMTFVPGRMRLNVDPSILHLQSQLHVRRRIKGIWSESGKRTQEEVSASRERGCYCHWRRTCEFGKRRRRGCRPKGIRIVSSVGVEEQSSSEWQGPCQALLLWRASTVDHFCQATPSSCGDPWCTRANTVMAWW